MIVAGVDGGGSKTEALILDVESSRVIGWGRSGPSNYHNVGLDTAVKNIVDSLIEALSMAGIDTVDVLCIALAGLDTRYDLEFMRHTLSNIGFAKTIIVEHDAHAALMAGTLGKPGVVVIAGTGSIAYAWDGEERIIVGNHGWLLGDEGSGFWIGFNALRLAVRMLDGRLPRSRLADLVLKYFRVSSLDELSFQLYERYKNGVRVDEIAGLAKVVVEASKYGDKYARDLLYEAGRLLAEQAIIAAKRLKSKGIPSPPIFYTGGVFKIREVIESFSNTINEALGYRPLRLRYKPVVGSIVIALKAVNREINLDNVLEFKMLLSE